MPCSSRKDTWTEQPSIQQIASAITVIYAWTILRERPARAVLLGAALVCAGVVILAL